MEEIEDDGGNFLLDLICMMVDVFHWNPGDLAKTDIDLIFPLAIYYPHWKAHAEEQAQKRKLFADQADWL